MSDKERIQKEAFKRIEELSESQESGERLVEQLKLSKDSLHAAIEESESPEEEMPYRFALQSITSLEAVLAAKGRKRRLSPEEKAFFKDIVGDISKLNDSLFKLVYFREHFDEQMTNYAEGFDEVEGLMTSGKFDGATKDKLEKTLKFSQNARGAYGAFLFEMTTDFGVDAIPQEISNELEARSKDVLKLEEKDRGLQNALEAYELREEMAQYLKKEVISLGDRQELEALKSRMADLSDKPLHRKVRETLEDNLDVIATNLDKFDGLDSLRDHSSAAELVEMLDAVKARFDGLDEESQIIELAGILMRLSASSHNYESLPTSSSFYGDLLDLYAQVTPEQIEALPVVERAQILSMRGLLIMLKEKATRAEQFEVGQVIVRELVDKNASGPYAGAGMQEGKIVNIDVFGGRLQVDKNGHWYDFDELGDGKHFLQSEQGDERQVVKRFEGGEGEKLLQVAQRMIVEEQIADRNEKTKVRHELTKALAIYKEKGWVSINEEGEVTLNDTCPNERLHEVAGEIMSQFNFEDIALIQDAINGSSETDKFKEATLLMYEVDKLAARGEMDKAKNALVRFLENVEQFEEDELSDDLLAAKEMAKERLKGMSLAAINKLRKIAGEIFGEKKGYKEYYKRVLINLRDEERRLKASSDYRIKTDSLMRTHYSDASVGSIRGASIGVDRTDPFGSNRGLEELAFRERSKELRTVPNKSVIDLWNQVVEFESKTDFGKDYSEEERLRKYGELADRFRFLKGKEYWERGADVDNPKLFKEDSKRFPATAGMYYREALGPEMKMLDIDLAKYKAEKSRQLEAKRGYFKKEAKGKMKDQFKELTLDDIELYALKNPQLPIPENLTQDQLDKLKADILGNDEIMESLADGFIDTRLNQEVEKAFLKPYERGIGTQISDLFRTDEFSNIEKLIDLEDPLNELLNFEDGKVEMLMKEVVTTVLIVGLSMGLGAIAALGARMTALALRGAQAARWAQRGNLAYRGSIYGVRTAGFTVGETYLSGKKGFNNFGSDWTYNLAMFGTLDVAGSMWRRIGTKYLVGSVEAGKVVNSEVYNAVLRTYGRRGASGLKALDAAGGFATEVAGLTAFQFGDEVVDMDWPNFDVTLKDPAAVAEEVDWAHKVFHNVAMVAALRAGNRPFEPFHRGIDKMEKTMVENADPKIFLEKYGLKEGYFSSGGGTKIEKMNRVRDFVDYFNLPHDVFNGKSRKEVEATIQKISEIMGLNAPNKLTNSPTRSELMEVYGMDPVLFDAIANKLQRLDLGKEQVLEIFGKHPEMMLMHVEKTKANPSDILPASKMKQTRNILVKMFGEKAGQAFDKLKKNSPLFLAMSLLLLTGCSSGEAYEAASILPSMWTVIGYWTLFSTAGFALRRWPLGKREVPGKDADGNRITVQVDRGWRSSLKVDAPLWLFALPSEAIGWGVKSFKASRNVWFELVGRQSLRTYSRIGSNWRERNTGKSMKNVVTAMDSLLPAGKADALKGKLDGPAIVEAYLNRLTELKGKITPEQWRQVSNFAHGVRQRFEAFNKARKEAENKKDDASMQEFIKRGEEFFKFLDSFAVDPKVKGTTKDKLLPGATALTGALIIALLTALYLSWGEDKKSPEIKKDQPSEQQKENLKNKRKERLKRKKGVNNKKFDPDAVFGGEMSVEQPKKPKTKKKKKKAAPSKKNIKTKIENKKVEPEKPKEKPANDVDAELDKLFGN